MDGDFAVDDDAAFGVLAADVSDEDVGDAASMAALERSRSCKTATRDAAAS